MNSALTRRALVQCAAMGAAVAVAPVSAASSAPDLDATLLDLIDLHGKAEAEVARLLEASDEAWRAALDAYPPRPEALLWREGDFPRTSIGWTLAKRGDDDVRRYDGKAALWLRDRPAETWFPTVVPPLGPECEARRLEILAAWDAYTDARRAVEDHVGYRALAEAEDAAAGLVVALAGEIKRARPATLAGLRALARWAGRQGADGSAHDDLLTLFAGTVAAFGEVAA